MEKTKKTFMIKKRKDMIFVLSLLAVPILHFLIFWLYVNFDSIFMAFKMMDDFGNEVWTLKNFSDMFKEFALPSSMIKEATFNTIIIFLTGALIAMPLSIIAAYFVMKKMPLGNFYKILFFLPSMISMVAFVYVFSYFIGVDGPLQQLVIDLGFPRESFPVFLGEGKAFATIIFYNIWSGIGFSTIIASSNMGRIPMEIFESAKLEGISYFSEFTKIVVPLIWPTIATMVVFNLAGMFGYMGPVMLMTEGSYNTSTIGYFIFSKVTSGDPKQLYYPAAIGLFFTAVAAPIILVVRKVMNSFWQDVTF